MALDQAGLEMQIYVALKEGFSKSKNPEQAQRKLAKDLAIAIVAAMAKLQVQTTVTVATPVGPGAGVGIGKVF